jgi:predicted O-methyltransferase YrrM
LLRPAAPAAAHSATWSAPRAASPLAELRAAVLEEDWERNYQEGLTKIHMRAEWSASLDRCSTLQWLAKVNDARQALEIGSFCGVGALALAEGLPADGEVQLLELDPFVVQFGRRFQMKSLNGSKIKRSVGPALPALEGLAGKAKEGLVKPFDLVIVDADKEGMQQYFDLLWSSPGLLSDGAVVCVDMTPFKGQPPTRYLKYGFPHRWQSSSGQTEIEALRAAVRESPDLVAHEFGGLLVVQRREVPGQ